MRWWGQISFDLTLHLAMSLQYDVVRKTLFGKEKQKFIQMEKKATRSGEKTGRNRNLEPNLVWDFFCIIFFFFFVSISNQIRCNHVGNLFSFS